MKKLFLLVLAVAVCASALGVQVGTAHAEESSLITYEGGQYVWGTGIEFTFDATGFRNKDLKDASIYVGSDFYDLYCWVRKEEGKILCVARGGLTEFAGQTGIIYLAGQIFYVIIPARYGVPDEEESFACPDGEIPGADVTFITTIPSFTTFFVPGSTDGEVYSNASSYLGGFYQSIDGFGDLYCRFFEEN